MLNKPISPLRQRMIDDMTARRFKEKVQKDAQKIAGKLIASGLVKEIRAKGGSAGLAAR